jgi:hypothetical protein
MMHEEVGLYKEAVEMLYSGALSAAPHNCVDADATAGAPQQGHQSRAYFLGVAASAQRRISLAGVPDGEHHVRADPPRYVHLNISVLTHVSAAQL